MKSPKEIRLEEKILEKLKHFEKCTQLASYLLQDEEL